MKIKFLLNVLIAAFLFSGAQAQPQGEATQGGAVAGGIAMAKEETSYVKAGNVTVNFKDADIRAVLDYFAEVSGVDIVPSPDVTGSVTLKLTDKPWETALDILVKNYGYAYEREENIIRVVTVSSLKLEELSTEVIPLNYATAEDARAVVKDMVTDRGKLAYDSRVNALIVTDLPTNIYRIKQVVKDLDKRTPQIMIEARILETLLEKDEKMGIDWNMKISVIGAKRPTTIPFQVYGGLQPVPHEIFEYLPRGRPTTTSETTPSGGGAAVETTTSAEYPSDWVAPFPFVDISEFTYGTLDFTQFQAVLELLKQRVRTEIISNPRITTLNHKEAKILVGRVYNFPTFSQVEETGRWVISGYNATELGIKLLVTPHVNVNNEIVIELKPEISNYLGLEKISEELSAPKWSTREADTQIMVKDGDTIFIGGLVKENNIDIEKKVPLIGDLFGDIPVVGGLVKHKGQEKEKTELIFFITVHIVKDMNTLLKFATRDVSETVVPDDIKNKEAEGSSGPEQVFIEMPEPDKSPASKKEHKPLFDFRKKKK
ncbi:MAG: hypothetical protein A2Z72_00570 [Omnitrophica bacterium RBG_13_46_9]|nr:MAG: hypothetical protein A2Z72_00570 [Omnitrophica bacterium RBG_13_46_9]